LQDEPIENSLTQVKSLVKDNNKKLFTDFKKYSKDLLSFKFLKVPHPTPLLRSNFKNSRAYTPVSVIPKGEGKATTKENKIKFTQSIAKQKKALKIS
jgi:hypothetical protein